MTHRSHYRPGLLTRLARNEAGNTIAILAASLVPLAGMIGGGLDLSRAYLVKTRLAQACDAGVLAGRKLMGSSGTVSTPVTNEVRKYVNFNFPQNYMGTDSFTITPTLGTQDQIVLTLSTNVPTAIMRLFGKNDVAVSTTCSARNDYSNIDIVLVLDTTGSMACKPERGASNCSNWINNNDKTGKTTVIGGKTVTYVEEERSGGTNISRMQGLRTALTTLQTEIGKIETEFASAPSATRKRVRWAIVPFSQMVNAGMSTGSAGTTLYTRQPTWFNTTGDYKQWQVQCDKNGKNCNYSVASNDDVSHSGSWLANIWDGCVEERRTSNAITPNSGHSIPNNLPSTAYDLKFDEVPASTDTRWTVADPEKTTPSQYACPKAMRELQPMSSTDFNNYFQANTGFLANGGTYLDIGLLWAARLLSPTGLWSGDNPATYNGYNVSRYVIFMTDGEMDTGNSGYGAYGQEAWWKRVAADGTADTSDDNHSQRMLMTCGAIKNMNVKIFAISFGAGSNLTSLLTGCSSGAGFGYKADDTSGLQTAFRDIGKTIGSLRLSR